MKRSLIALMLMVSIIAPGMGQTWNLPPQDLDKIGSSTANIAFTNDGKTIAFVESHFDSLRLHHYHRRYTASVYEIDTVVLLTNFDETQLEVRALMCDGVGFEVDDPYKGKVDTYSEINDKVRIGYWHNTATMRSKLLNVISEVNAKISAKANCNQKRDFKPYLCYRENVSIDQDMRYSAGCVMPTLNLAKSVKARNEQVQKAIEKCLGKVEGKHLFKLRFVVDKYGNVLEPFSSDCPPALRQQVYDCISTTKWKPGESKGKAVDVNLSVLIGLNIANKFVALEEQSKTKKEDSNLPLVQVSIDEEMLFGNSEKEEHVYEIVETMPKLQNSNSIKAIIEKAKLGFDETNINLIVQFIVEKNGRISNFRILRSQNPNIKDWIKTEFMKLRYSPGKNRGKVVRVKVTERLRSE